MNAKPTRMLFAAVALSALGAVLASSAQARIPEGNGTRPPSRTVVDEQQATKGSGAFFVDPVYASLDPAIRIAIVKRSHAAPLAAKRFRTGTRQQRIAGTFPYVSYLGARWQDGGGQARFNTFPDGYRGLP